MSFLRSVCYLVLGLSCAATSLSLLAKPVSVLVLSILSEEQDRKVMQGLTRELRQFGASTEEIQVERVEINSDQSELAMRSEVQTALAKRKWQLIVATTGSSADLARREAVGVPLLFRTAANPLDECLIESLRTPSGGATGYTSDLPGEPKMLEALKQAYPAMTGAIMLVDGTPEESGQVDCNQIITHAQVPCESGPKVAGPNVATRDPYLDQASLARFARTRRLQLRYFQLCSIDDLPRLSPLLTPNTGVVVPNRGLFYEDRQTLVSYLNTRQVPAIYAHRAMLQAGGLMALLPRAEPLDAPPRGIEQARRILAGTPPGQIPVQRPEGLELTLNLRVARQLPVPPSKSALRAADHLLR
ncbi:ABC transporter substrate-binding protein [Ideonella sp.]|uniref:ABC transporter substrate-binding protein n=1 Tax=Ideonella sp. TaxID=1929293 RepID=UPI003BB6AF39